MPLFQRYIGIDYSGASGPDTPIDGLRVFVAGQETGPTEERNSQARTRSHNWSRQQLASWLLEHLQAGVPTIVGLDHAFSYPLEAIDKGARASWDDFLVWFEGGWPTRNNTVRQSLEIHEEALGRHRKALRLTDRWAPTAMPICDGWEGNRPNVFYSSHAGIPWLRWLRQEARGMVHFWPFDGFHIPMRKSVIAEVYPRIFRRRFKADAVLTADQRDAWLVCRWLKERDEKDCLEPYFGPPLDVHEQQQVGIEGWILGVA